MSALAGALLLNPFQTLRIPNPSTDPAEFFVGPFPSWTNLKANYGARGNGITDDSNALQAALDELGNAESSPVLWIPSGTYRITKTLTWTRNIGDGFMSILGEHPATTKILWDGAHDEIMFKTRDINNSRFGRITWDGKNRAGCVMQHTSSGSSSGNEHADEFFQNVGVGIRGGTMDTKMVAEMSVLRCRFRQCSRAGISLENANSLDWWIWDSQFQDCYVGVTSGYGQGAFHVFHSFFERSTFADTFIGFASCHVLADNISRNSRAFCLAPFSWNPLPLVIQRNTILDPTLGANPPEPRGGGLGKTFPYELHGPIAVKYFGPLLLLDNVTRSRATHKTPVVEIGEDVVAIGNTFTLPNAIQGKRVLELDTIVRAASEISSAPIEFQVPPRFTGKMFPVAQNATAAQIQKQINAAAREGNRAVVHLPHGRYALTQSLVIPPDSDIQIIGDGRTFLEWQGARDGSALDVHGALRATLRDFVVQQNANQATGVRITGIDQNDARIFAQGVQVRGRTHGFKIDALENAIVELRDSQSTNAFFDPPNPANAAAMFVRGGGKRARVNWFSGASSGSVPNFRVERGGALLVRALWYEGRAAQMGRFDDTGEFTLLGAVLARYGETNNPGAGIEVKNFRGNVALLSTQFVDAEKWADDIDALRVLGNESRMRVLVLGASGWFKRKLLVQDNAKRGEIGFLQNRSPVVAGDYVVARGDEYHGSEPAPHARFVRALLRRARMEKPMPLTATEKGIRMFRVYIFGFDVAVQVTA